MYLSTLRSHIEAMGGELDIIPFYGRDGQDQQLHSVGVNDLDLWAVHNGCQVQVTKTWMFSIPIQRLSPQKEQWPASEKRVEASCSW